MEDDPCTEYSHEHPGGASWGMSGEGDEGVTKNLACCLRQEEMSGVADAMRYEMAVSKYHHHYYDLSEGWEGRTFEEVLDFCDGIKGYSLYRCGAQGAIYFSYTGLRLIRDVNLACCKYFMFRDVNLACCKYFMFGLRCVQMRCAHSARTGSR